MVRMKVGDKAIVTRGGVDYPCVVGQVDFDINDPSYHRVEFTNTYPICFGPDGLWWISNTEIRPVDDDTEIRVGDICLHNGSEHKVVAVGLEVDKGGYSYDGKVVLFQALRSGAYNYQRHPIPNTTASSTIKKYGDGDTTLVRRGNPEEMEVPPPPPVHHTSSTCMVQTQTMTQYCPVNDTRERGGGLGSK